jgi:beta-phosphoglucomutase-like phosphatase (HAD superfamily)
MLNVPGDITDCLFDLDGVLTQTAKIHSQRGADVVVQDLGELL